MFRGWAGIVRVAPRAERFGATAPSRYPRGMTPDDLLWIPFEVGLNVPVNGLTTRSGLLVEGTHGWGEWSPLPSWTEAENLLGRRAALEAANSPFPAAEREAVVVAMLVPQVPPALAAAVALRGNCPVVKVQIGDPDGEERVAAVRDAIGPERRLRLVVDAPWSENDAEHWIRRFAQYNPEYIQDPVAGATAFARLRRRVTVPLAAGRGITTPMDAARFGTTGAADVIVVKPQRVGGAAATLDIADAAGLPVVLSSSLETSIGLAALVALAASLPDHGYAHGLGTGALLTADLVADPLLPIDGLLPVGRRAPILDLLAAPQTGPAC